MSFDVMREPWIDCVALDGSMVTLGIRELLLRAHELQAVRDISPLQEYGIYRLLCVIAMDMLKPRGIGDMEELLEEGRFDEKTVDSYIAFCEKDGPCFDLFDAQRPFMQDRFEGKEKSVAILVPEITSGNNHVHFMHKNETEQELSYSQCAKALCAANIFCWKNGSYPNTVNGDPPIYVLVNETNVYRKLIVNSVPKSAVFMGYDDPPPMYRNREIVDEASFSLLSGMTYKIRKIELIEADKAVRKIKYEGGAKFRGKDFWRDPYVAYDEDEKPIKYKESKETWRNLAMIFDINGISSPMVVRQHDNISDDEKVSVTLYWLDIKNNAKYSQWGKGILSLPKYIMACDWKFDVVRGCIKKSEEMAEKLKECFAYIDAAIECNKKMTKSERDKIKRKKQSIDMQYQINPYYNMVHNAIFGELIPKLKEALPSEEEKFRLYTTEIVRKAALESFNEKCMHTSNTIRMLKIMALAEDYLYHELNKMHLGKRKEQ